MMGLWDASMIIILMCHLEIGANMISVMQDADYRLPPQQRAASRSIYANALKALVSR